MSAVSLRDFVCADVSTEVDILGAPSLANLPGPALALPVVIDFSQAIVGDRKLALAKGAKEAGGCWRPIPNNFGLGTPDLSERQATPPGESSWPVKGDGWFFRVVAADPATTKDVVTPPLGSVPATEYFSKIGSMTSFPYSSCRKVDLQVTWLTELTKVMMDQTQKLRYIAYKNMTVADPSYVSLAKVPDGGIITYHSDCGANVVVNASAGFLADVSAALTEAQALLKAQTDAAATTTER